MLSKEMLEAVFVDTDWARDTILCKCGGCPEVGDRLIVVPSPCEPFAKTVSMEEARVRLSLPTRKCLLLFFGRLREDKGPDILLDAIRSLECDVILVIAGQEGYVTAGQVETFRMSLPGPAEVLPRIQYIEPDEESLYFTAADVVVLPYRKGFRGVSGVLHNAAAAGKPVIASDVGEIGGLVRRYSLGIVVEPESPAALRDGIRQFVQNRAEIEAAAQAEARRYVADHHWRRMAELVEAAFRGERPTREKA